MALKSDAVSVLGKKKGENGLSSSQHIAADSTESSIRRLRAPVVKMCRLETYTHPYGAWLEFYPTMGRVLWSFWIAF